MSIRVVYVNDDSTVFVEAYPTTQDDADAMPPTVYLAQRDAPSHTWGPPTTLTRDDR